MTEAYGNYDMRNRNIRKSTEEAERVLQYMAGSPTAFHVVETLRRVLLQAGFTELLENRKWEIEPGGQYFVTRNGSSILSFKIPAASAAGNFETGQIRDRLPAQDPVENGPEKGTFPDQRKKDRKLRPKGYRITASHSDSPAFKIKENPEMAGNVCVRLNTEKYGGGMWYTWMDRPLGVAGRLLVREKARGETGFSAVRQILAAPQELTLVIPSLAIHFNRDVNEKFSPNLQKDTLPLFALKSSAKSAAAGASENDREGCRRNDSDVGARNSGLDGDMLLREILREINAQEYRPEDVLGADLFLYAKDPGILWGPDHEFISAPHLDDQACVFASFDGFLRAQNRDCIMMHAVFDNEEVGSSSHQGAGSSFLADTMARIAWCLGMDEEEQQILLADSFMLSQDNAHAVHPNYAEKSDPVNGPLLGGGIVLKFNAETRYATDAVSGALVRMLCRDNGIPCQDFTNRSDIRGGSTLGTIASALVPLRTADIGIPQLAMHAAWETAAARDLEAMTRLSEAFFRLGGE